MKKTLGLTFQLAVIVVSCCALSNSFAQTVNYHLVRTVSLPSDDGWDYIYDDSSAHRLYVTRGTHVQVVDTSKGTLIGDIGGLNGIHGVAIDSNAGRGFISSGGSNSVTIFDLKTLQKIGADVPVDPGPDCIIFEPVTERVFTFNGESSTSTAIDAKTGQVVGHITLDGRPEFSVADGQGFIYNNVEDKSEVERIDAKTLKITDVWPTAPGESPSGIALDQKSRRAFSVCRNQTLAILDADSGKVVATPAIGNGPDACAFDPKTKLVFSPNGRDGTLSIFHEDTPNTYKLVQTVTTQSGARTMALDTKTGHVFLVAAKTLPPDPNGPAPAPGQRYRRRFAPGSFVVLEFAP
jgi:DNA-binding beta-propeller fold protein YncE